MCCSPLHASSTAACPTSCVRQQQPAAQQRVVRSRHVRQQCCEHGCAARRRRQCKCEARQICLRMIKMHWMRSQLTSSVRICAERCEDTARVLSVHRLGASVRTSRTCSRGGALSWRTSTSSDGSRSGSTSSRLRPIAIATTLTTAPRKLQLCEGVGPAAKSVTVTSVQGVRQSTIRHQGTRRHLLAGHCRWSHKPVRVMSRQNPARQVCWPAPGQRLWPCRAMSED